MACITDALALEDFFAVGLGCDISGAYLLAKGLLTSPGAIARQRAAYYGINAADTVAAAQDRVAAVYGVGALMLGFFLQLVGYVAALATEDDDLASRSASVIAVGLCVLAAGSVMAIWHLRRRNALMRLLVEISCYGANDRERGLPSAETLRFLGAELGDVPKPQERTPGGAAEYARRVFDVAEVEPAQQHFPEELIPDLPATP